MFSFRFLLPWLHIYEFGGARIQPPAPVPTIVNPANTASLNAAELSAAGARGAGANDVAGVADAYMKRQLTAADMAKRGRASNDLLV